MYYELKQIFFREKSIVVSDLLALKYFISIGLERTMLAQFKYTNLVLNQHQGLFLTLLGSLPCLIFLYISPNLKLWGKSGIYDYILEHLSNNKMRVKGM